jgi:hypothetical protein
LSIGLSSRPATMREDDDDEDDYEDHYDASVKEVDEADDLIVWSCWKP